MKRLQLKFSFLLILFSLFSKAQIPTQSEFRVNTYFDFDQRDPSVANNNNGDFVIVWQSDFQDGDSYGVYAQLYDNNNMPKGGEFRVNSDTLGYQGHPTVVMKTDGSFIVSWISVDPNTNIVDILIQMFDNNAVPQGNPITVNTTSIYNQGYPVIAMNDSGDFVIAWERYFTQLNYADIYARQFDSSGTPKGNEFRVNTFLPDAQRYPDVAINDNGAFVVTWQSNLQDYSTSIYAQRFDSNGIPQGNEFKANTFVGTQRIPAVAMNNNMFTIVWESENQDGDDYGIYAQRFDNNSVPQGNEFKVNTNTINEQRSADIAIDDVGNFIITWFGYDWGTIFVSGSRDIKMRRFDNNGTPQSIEYKVNDFPGLSQREPAIALNDNGQFVITWLSDEQISFNYGIEIYAKCYDLLPVSTKSAVLQDEVTFEIYPNPVQSKLIINLSSLDNVSDGIIYNQSGQIVMRFELKDNLNVLDISTLDNGSYYLKINTINEYVRQFIKSN